MGSIRENLEVIREILTSKWYWIIVILGILILLGPFILVWSILYLPTPLNVLATFALVIAWGIVAGYKDWILQQIREEKRE
jgi:hypothetical protein